MNKFVYLHDLRAHWNEFTAMLGNLLIRQILLLKTILSQLVSDKKDELNI